MEIWGAVCCCRVNCNSWWSSNVYSIITSLILSCSHERTNHRSRFLWKTYKKYCELPLEAIVKNVTGLRHSCFNLCFCYMEVCKLNPGGDLQSTSIPAGRQPVSHVGGISRRNEVEPSTVPQFSALPFPHSASLSRSKPDSLFNLHSWKGGSMAALRASLYAAVCLSAGIITAAGKCDHNLSL